MMDYKEKYDAALEIAKECLQDGTITTIARAYIWEIFPELKEPEYENKRISKEISQFVKQNNGWNNEWLTWLERQGKQKTDPCANCINDKGCITCENGNLKETKVAPKFKVGDWIIDNNFGNTYQIETATEIESEHIFGYTIVGGGYFNDNSDVRLWTINDAKDGDVLVMYDIRDNIEWLFLYRSNPHKLRIYDPRFYCHYDLKSNIFKKDADYVSVAIGTKFRPATKEQRDLLFQKMKEAGWEWNNEKKELKKIEPKTLDADKVIEWLRQHLCTACWDKPDEAISLRIDKFKQDFGL